MRCCVWFPGKLLACHRRPTAQQLCYIVVTYESFGPKHTIVRACGTDRAMWTCHYHSNRNRRFFVLDDGVTDGTQFGNLEHLDLYFAHHFYQTLLTTYLRFVVFGQSVGGFAVPTLPSLPPQGLLGTVEHILWTKRGVLRVQTICYVVHSTCFMNHRTCPMIRKQCITECRK